MNKNHIIFFLLFNFMAMFAQAGGNLTITGDSLKGKVIDGLNIREVIGSVVIKQDDVTITCNKAIQYISSNMAELIGNVVLTQDSVVITTERGRYFGNTKQAFSDTTVTLTNGKLKLIANKGEYNLRTKTAKFNGDVDFTDTQTKLKSQKLVYQKEIEKIIATDSVRVSDSTSIIASDSLIHLRTTRFSEGFGNVKIWNVDNDITIFGDHLVDDKETKHTQIDGSPFLTQIEELNDGTYDTLFIKSAKMEAYKDSSSRLVAIDSVKIIRGEFSSVNDFTIYDRTNEEIKIFKQKESKNPILWYEKTQTTGDSIIIKLDSSRISSVDIFHNGVMISQDSTYTFRFDQMSGDTIKLGFSNGSLSSTNVFGNVLSIYYLYEEGEANGLLKSSANQIKIVFSENKVSDVKMFGNPESEYHPENKVIGNEKSFTLPTFLLHKNKPDKNNIVKEFNSKRKYNYAR